MAAEYPELPAYVSVETREKRGRGLFVTKNVKRGTPIVKATPACAIFDLNNLQGFCNFCGIEAAHLDKPLLQCSGCKSLKFCSAACQKAAWKPEEHKLECAALQRYSKAHGPDKKRGLQRSVPDTPIRALGRLIWSKSVKRDGWWAQILALQSHRADLPEEQKEYFTRLSMLVAQYVGEEYTTAAFPGGGHQLLDFCCAFASNTFSLTLPDLSNVGVAISPVVALANHSCQPNAVVVFPHGPRKASGMQIIAINDLAPGDEVLTSYVDLSIPKALRQAELFDRYRFTCDCLLCTRRERETDWIDPRESLACTKEKCDGMARMPDLTRDDAAEVKCESCGNAWSVSCKDLAEEMRVGQSVLDALEKSNGENLAEHLRTCVRSLSSHLHPASHFLFALLRATQLAYIDAGLFNDALAISTKVSLAMKHLYPPSHPVAVVQLVTFEKLLENVHGQEMPFPFAIATLRNSIAGAEVGFGPGGGEVGRSARELLQNLELGFEQYRVHQKMLQAQK